jgi:hypothetical protein
MGPTVGEYKKRRGGTHGLFFEATEERSFSGAVAGVRSIADVKIK